MPIKRAIRQQFHNSGQVADVAALRFGFVWDVKSTFPPSLVAATFFGSSFSFSLATSSASTSFVSRRTGPRDFVRFDVDSLFFPELLCFFMVDLLSCFDCTSECVDHR
jgi:hypothetical protein